MSNMNEFLTAPRPIRNVLIANRGEIACRIIATCNRLGLRAIAVHSEADTPARHVRLADAAHAIGPASPSKSYLVIDEIIAAAKATGADAVHPGYGFLSENAGFAQRVIDAGLVFVGPSPDAVAHMGSKIEARSIAQAAGIPVVPGFADPDASADEFAVAAADIGFPVLVKASAGGGGRGMRRVMTPAGLPAAIDSARKEAASAFGDATVFLEKLILRPRHLEVQVFGDGQGGALHFHERDCSVQRNHQKLIEEAPAPNLPEVVRNALFTHAISLTSAINYAGAGTVEFVMGAGDDAPYFLEMNTRLQVEHPVSEEICGVDLVEWQLRQAAGLPLPLTQDQIRPKGHAIEIRLNAERPDAGFMPDTGRITALTVPGHVRFETGIEQGDTVSSHYDSMLAKLIAYGPDRDATLHELVAGIDGTVIAGPGNNLAFLRDCLTAPSFVQGKATTAFLDENFPNGWQPDPETLLRLRGQAALVAIAGTDNPQSRTDGFRVDGRAAPGRVPLMVEDEYGSAELCLHLGTAPRVTEAERDIALGPASHYVARSDTSEGGGIQAVTRGLSITLNARALASARRAARQKDALEGTIFAPLTGLVTDVRVELGAPVAKGDVLMVMEAMKLVHSLSAPFDGTVTRLSASQGETVTAKTVLMEIEENT